jgi:hypothetical protein
VMESSHKMEFTGKFDLERFALFQCCDCAYRAGIKPTGLVRYKCIHEGSGARHSVFITPSLFPADVFKTLWGMDLSEYSDSAGVRMEMTGEIQAV